MESEQLLKLPRDISGHDLKLDLCLKRSFCRRTASVEKPVNVMLGINTTCYSCGKDVDVFTDGTRLFTDAEPCKYPDGIPTTEFVLNVPSGKVVIANDLRGLFPCDEPRDSINTEFGCRATTLAYAEVGMAHGFVGNTCPAVYKLGDKLWIGKPDRRGAKKVAGICTDLWWYSIVDYDEFARRADQQNKTTNEMLKAFDADVVPVAAGSYLFKHDSSHANADKTGLYATFERIDAAQPVIDYIAADVAKHVTPEQYIAQSMRDWPSLYVEEFNVHAAIEGNQQSKRPLVDSIMAVADHILCTNGNGLEWHPNGHPRIRLDPDIAANPKPLEIPTFTKGVHWYPISEGYCTLARAAGIQSEYSGHGEERLSPEFAKLAFNILQSIILYGYTPYTEKPEYVKEARRVMNLAVKIYWKLAERYPDAAKQYQEFAEWMLSNKNSLNDYCNNFSFNFANPKKWIVL